MNEIVRVPVEQLTLHPDNARVGDVDAIARSLERHGQTKPLIVQRSTGYVVAGNHTLKAIRQLGWSHAECVIMDMDDRKARLYLVEDNMISDKAGYDSERKEALLESVFGDEQLEQLGIRDEWESLREERLGKREKPKGPSGERIEVEGKDVDDAPVPTRSVPLLVPTTDVGGFTQKVQDLQELWGGRTLSDIVLRAVDEAHDRWKAGVGRTGSAQALPEMQKAEF